MSRKAKILFKFQRKKNEVGNSPQVIQLSTGKWLSVTHAGYHDSGTLLPDANSSSFGGQRGRVSLLESVIAMDIYTPSHFLFYHVI